MQPESKLAFSTVRTYSQLMKLCRFILKGDDLLTSLVPDSAGIFRFDEAYGLNETFVSFLSLPNSPFMLFCSVIIKYELRFLGAISTRITGCVVIL